VYAGINGLQRHRHTRARGGDVPAARRRSAGRPGAHARHPARRPAGHLAHRGHRLAGL